jgi:hypothetical protein
MRALIMALAATCAPAPLLANAVPAAPDQKPAETPIPFVKADAEKAVVELATALEENFVFPDKGKAYADMLRANLAAGRYASFANAEDFAGKVTEDLQAIHKDGHLRVRPVTEEMKARRHARGGGGSPDKSAIARAGWIADGVAYIDTRGSTRWT